MSRSMYFALSLVAIAVMLLGCAQALQDRKAAIAAAKRPFGAFTESQIIARSQPVFASLLPGHTSISLTAERHGERWRGGSSHRFWNLKCLDEQKRVVASMLLDADTGRAQKVSVGLSANASFPACSPAISSQAISSATAVAAASALVGTLGYHERWKVCEPPVASDIAWHIKLSATGRTALVCLNRRTAALVYASVTGQSSRYTGAQIAGMCRPLFHELLPGLFRYAVKVERHLVQTHDGSNRRRWDITCVDAQRNGLARLVRDADTGATLSFSGKLSGASGSMTQQTPLDSAAALSIAKRCVQLLGYTEEVWRGSETSESGRVRHLQLMTAENSARLTLDKQTGALLYASFQTKN